MHAHDGQEGCVVAALHLHHNSNHTSSSHGTASQDTPLRFAAHTLVVVVGYLNDLREIQVGAFASGIAAGATSGERGVM